MFNREMHRAVGAYDAPPPAADDDEWDTDPDFVNKNNQENAKAQKLANKQLGGIRTATEAAAMVKNNQVEMDRQRGITSVNGIRAQQDQALMQQKAREGEEFARRQAQQHSRTDQAIAARAAEAKRIEDEKAARLAELESKRAADSAQRNAVADKIRSQRDAELKRAEEAKKAQEQQFFQKQSQYLAQKDQVIAARDQAKKAQEDDRELQAKQREDNRLKMQAQRDAEAERLRKQRDDEVSRGEAAKKAADANFAQRQAAQLAEKDKIIASRDQVRQREEEAKSQDLAAREQARLKAEADRAAAAERLRQERGFAGTGGGYASDVNQVAAAGGVGNKAAAFKQASDALKTTAPEPQRSGKAWTPPAAAAAPAPAAARQPEPEPEPYAEEPAYAAEPAADAYDDNAGGAYSSQPPADDGNWGAAADDGAAAGGAYSTEPPAEDFGGAAAEDAPAGGYSAGAGDGSIQVTAVYDYVGENEGDLSFNEGDTITVTDQSDPDGWWVGVNNTTGASGAFPSNYCQ